MPALPGDVYTTKSKFSLDAIQYCFDYQTEEVLKYKCNRSQNLNFCFTVKFLRLDPV